MKDRNRSTGKFIAGNKAAQARSKNKGIRSFVSDTTKHMSATPLQSNQKTYGFNKWKRFGVNDNLPIEFAMLNINSPKQGGIYNRKVDLVNGIDIISDEKLLITNEANKTQSLHELSRDYFENKFGIGGTYMEIVWDSNKTFVYYYITDSVQCRIGDEDYKDHIIIFDDFNNKNITKSKQIPIYPDFKKGNDGLMHSYIYIKDSSPPGYQVYGYPSWIAARKSANTDYRMEKWNDDKVKNSFATSGIMLGDFADDEEAKKAQKKLSERNEKDRFAVLVFQKTAGGENAAEYIPLNNTSDGDWNNLMRNIEGNLILNWKVPRSLLNISESTGFDTKRILNDYEIFKNTVMLPEQRLFINTINRPYMDILNIDLSQDVKFVNKLPVSISSMLTNIDSVIEVGEARTELGLSNDGKETDKFIKNESNSNKRGDN